MRAPTIRPGGHTPNGDGDVNLYINPEASGQSWFNHGRRVIFVNGMDNSPTDHAQSAMALSLLQGCPVIGVYNRTDGVWADLGQCIRDKLTLAHMDASLSGVGIESWTRMFQTLLAAARLRNPAIDPVDVGGELVRGNAATYALYGLMAGGGHVDMGRTPIYCHSQGNLITSNALTAMAVARGMSAISGIEINSFGSPCRYWPPGIQRTNNAFTFDPVSWLDLTMDLSSSKIGFVAGHAFTLYMQNDAEFTVNRFRWGSFGMTASMDEAGLARYMIRMGNNPGRLRGILARLDSAHNSDADDVAYEYTTRASDSLLRQIKSSAPDVIATLIRLMDEGVTFPSESEAILRLRSI